MHMLQIKPTQQALSKIKLKRNLLHWKSVSGTKNTQQYTNLELPSMNGKGLSCKEVELEMMCLLCPDYFFLDLLSDIYPPTKYKENILTWGCKT